MAGPPRCPAGHAMPGRRARLCPACRREQVISQVTAVDPSLSKAGRGRGGGRGRDPSRRVARPGRGARRPTRTRWPGAHPRGGAAGHRADRPRLDHPERAEVRGLRPHRTSDSRSPSTGACASGAPPAATRAACTHCGAVKPVAGRSGDGAPICEACRRHQRGQRRCGICGKTTSIAVRAHDDKPDICGNCYRLPAAICHVCGRLRPCTFATSDRPICKRCAPRTTAACARCGHDRPPAVRWDEGPLCDRCYTAALRHRGRCAPCGTQRGWSPHPGRTPRPAPTAPECRSPTPAATADWRTSSTRRVVARGAACAAAPRAAVRPYRGRPARTDRSVRGDLRGPHPTLGVELAAQGRRRRHPRRPCRRTACRHPRRTRSSSTSTARRLSAADAHHRWRPRPPRRGTGAHRAWLADLLAAIEVPEHRRLVHTFATWRVMRRLRRNAETRSAPRTHTGHAKNKVKACGPTS